MTVVLEAPPAGWTNAMAVLNDLYTGAQQAGRNPRAEESLTRPGHYRVSAVTPSGIGQVTFQVTSKGFIDKLPQLLTLLSVRKAEAQPDEDWWQE